MTKMKLRIRYFDHPDKIHRRRNEMMPILLSNPPSRKVRIMTRNVFRIARREGSVTIGLLIELLEEMKEDMSLSEDTFVESFNLIEILRTLDKNFALDDLEIDNVGFLLTLD